MRRTLLAAALALVALPSTASAFDLRSSAGHHPHALRATGAGAPNDPFFGGQWGLRNTGQTIGDVTGVAGADIDAVAAWARTTGSTAVKVAVVDSGINFDQPDFAGNIWTNPGESGGGREHNGVDDDHNGYVDDFHGWDFVQQDNDPSDNYGHGTHVAGTIAARGDNTLGMTGVAWRASIIPVRVLDNVDSGYCDEIAAGMAYAVRAGARIVNLSTGNRMYCQAERDVIRRAPNVLFVAAAMNDGMNVDATPYYPCAYPEANVVCVAATDSRDRLASFSDYGAVGVDLAAPGVSVLGPYVKWGAKQSLFSDGFETPLDGRWTTGGSPNTWQRTPFAPLNGGGFSLAPSVLGTYSSNSDSWVRLDSGLDLTGRRDCGLSVQLNSTMAGFNPQQPIEAQDRLIMELSTDGVHWDRRPTVITGATSGFLRWIYDLSPLEGRSNGHARFRLVTNGDAVNGKLALDDLEVFCVPPLTDYTGAVDEFLYDWGTSMAAPHVSGTAVLLLAQNSRLTAVELKQRLLASVDRLPGLAGKVATGGRLNAGRALVPPAGGAPPVTNVPTQDYALTIDVKALALDLRKHGRRAILRRGGIRVAKLHAISSGRFRLVVKTRGRTVAKGSRACAGPAVCSLTARLTRRGRAALRRSRHPRLSLALSFAPSSGRTLVRHAAVRLGR